MSSTKSWSVAESNAFIEIFELGPWKSGPLSGLQFAASDLIDIEARPTGCGNPAWLENRAPAACNALCIDVLLSSGAQCIGKTKSDEFTFSLLGESSFSGTPVNPRAVDRVPGGSASGAASAVACSLVQFAIALDSGAGTQVAASNCGLYGYRPRFGTVPMAGVMPISPSFDTVGMLASQASTITILLELFSGLDASSTDRSAEICLVSDCWDRAEPAVRDLLHSAIDGLTKKVALKRRDLTLKQALGVEAGDLQNWYKTYIELYSMESWCSLGTWIEDRKPELGRETRANIHKARRADRSESSRFFKQRELFSTSINHFLKDKKLICIPAVSDIAPTKGFIAGPDDPGNYYPNTISLASIAAIGRLAVLTLPIAELNGAPLGLSFLAADESILLTLLKNLQLAKC